MCLHTYCCRDVKVQSHVAYLYCKPFFYAVYEFTGVQSYQIVSLYTVTKMSNELQTAICSFGVIFISVFCFSLSFLDFVCSTVSATCLRCN